MFPRLAEDEALVIEGKTLEPCLRLAVLVYTEARKHYEE